MRDSLFEFPNLMRAKSEALRFGAGGAERRPEKVQAQGIGKVHWKAPQQRRKKQRTHSVGVRGKQKAPAKHPSQQAAHQPK